MNKPHTWLMFQPRTSARVEYKNPHVRLFYQISTSEAQHIPGREGRAISTSRSILLLFYFYVYTGKGVAACIRAVLPINTSLCRNFEIMFIDFVFKRHRRTKMCQQGLVVLLVLQLHVPNAPPGGWVEPRTRLEKSSPDGQSLAQRATRSRPIGERFMEGEISSTRGQNMLTACGVRDAGARKRP